MAARLHIAFLAALALALAVPGLAWAYQPGPGALAGPRGSAPGSLVWAKVSALTANIDQINDVAAGPGGSVYAVGEANGTWSNQGDLLVVKYTASGGVAWRRTYDGPDGLQDYGWALAVDHASNVVAVGVSNTVASGSDMLVVKYDAAGNQKWVVDFNGAGNGDDVARDVVFGSSGKIFVAGMCTVESVPTVVTEAYELEISSAGTVVNQVGYSGAGSDAEGVAIAKDGSGNTYVAGTTHDTGTTSSIILFKTSSAGAPVWMHELTTAGHTNDAAKDIAFGNGAVYVCGTSVPVPAHHDDALVVKYSPAGSFQWARTWDGAAHEVDQANALAVDNAGDVYAAGLSWQFGGAKYKALLLKWDAAGHRKWVKLDGSTKTFKWAGFEDVVVDNAGHAWCGGWAARKSGDIDWFLTKHAANGSQSWMATFGGASHGDDSCQSLALGGSSALFAGGSVQGSTTGYDVAVAKFVP